MMSDAAKQRIEELEKQYRELEKENKELRVTNSLLYQDVCLLRSKLYGKKSENGLIPVPDTSHPDLFEDMSEATPEEIKEETKPVKRERRAPKAKKIIPDHLPRKEEVVDLPEEEKVCEKCGKGLAHISDAVTEVLEYIPAQVYIRKIIRRKYVCNCCKDHFAEASLNRVIPRSKCGDSLLAALIISKYADHLPLYRQEKMFARHKIHLTRNVMCDNLMEVARQLRPLVAAMKEKLLDSSLIGADETTIQMVKNFKKSEGKSKKCYLWVYHGDDKAPYTIFDFNESRSHSVPLETLGEYTGYLQTDGYGGYETMLGKTGYEPSITHCCCWAHVRRKFVDAEKAGDSRATEAIEIIKELYKVESQLKELKTDEERLSLRQEKSKPILAQFRKWMDDRLDVLPGSLLGKAIGYANERWEKLTIYADTPNVPIDNNAVERAIRPVAVGRKNWLFAGSEMGGEAAATFFTLIESAKRCEVDPWIYIQTLLEKIVTHSTHKLDELIPNNIELPADARLSSDTPAQPQG